MNKAPSSASLSIRDAWSSHSGATPDDPTTPERLRKLRQALSGLASGSRVLDFGCGRGEFTRYLKELGFRATGADISETAITANRRDYPDLEFLCLDERLASPVAVATFDAIWCSEVIEHVYDVNVFFSQLNRLLSPGGLLILTTPYHGLIKNLLIASFRFEKHFNVEYQHIRFWTRRSLTAVAHNHGFAAIRWDTIGRVPWLAKSFFVVFEKKEDSKVR